MNFRFVINQLGLLLIVLSGILLVVAGWEVLDVWMGHTSELHAMQSLLLTLGAGLVSGGALWLFGSRARKDRFGRREAMLLVALSWIVGAALSALPFWFWAMHHEVQADHPFHRYIDCYFEAMSGLTTTGASVLGAAPNDIESLPRGLLLWRSLTHWLGGLGIVVLFVAVLPTLGVGGKKIFHVEAPGPKTAGVRPRIRETARVLWMMYVGLTVAEIIALRLCGMSWFDSINHTFATLATGGFSTRNASIGAYGNAAMFVIIGFMFLAGVNFGLYYQLLRGHVQILWRDTELRFYVALMTLGAFAIAVSLYFAGQPIVMTDGSQIEPTLANAARQSLFNTVSIHTTTGFCTADFNQWPTMTKVLLVLFMFIGGSAGSTAGGIKVIRIWIALKVVLEELERVFRPSVIRPMRVGGASIDPEMRLSVVAYVMGIVILFALGAVAILLIENGKCDFATASTASIATLFNIGPGLAQVGPVENYGWFTPASKVILSLLMALGRLEVFAIFVLFLPHFWRGE